MDTKDYGPHPHIVDIERLTLENENYRTTHWTGKNLQMTTMSIPVDGEVGLEKHDELDQFLRIEQGVARVEMGEREDSLDFVHEVGDDFAIFVPAGMWHNIVNTGTEPLKLYSIYAPPEHAHGTIHETFADDPEH